MDFIGVVAPRMLHDFKFEPNRSTLRYPADPPKKGQNHHFWLKILYLSHRVPSLKKFSHGLLALKIHLKLFSSGSRRFPGIKMVAEKSVFSPYCRILLHSSTDSEYNMVLLPINVLKFKFLKVNRLNRIRIWGHFHESITPYLVGKVVLDLLLLKAELRYCSNPTIGSLQPLTRPQRPQQPLYGLHGYHLHQNHVLQSWETLFPTCRIKLVFH